MIVETLVVCGTLGEYCLRLTRDRRYFTKHWDNVMTLLNAKNELGQYFEILKYIKTEYGFDVIISIPDSLSYNDLLKHKDVIESNFSANIIMEWKKEDHCIYTKFYKQADNLCLQNDIEFKWNEMISNGDKLFTKSGKSFKITKINKKQYGFNMDIEIPSGLCFGQLESLKPKIEDGFKAIVDIRKKDFINTVYVVTKPFDDNVKYTPVPVKAYELYLGMTYYYEPLIISMKRNPHVNFSGINNSGKSVCMLNSIVNTTYFNSPKTMQLYLIQLSAKKDLRKLANLKHTQYYADTPHKAQLTLQYLYNEMIKRNKLFNSIQKVYVDNIFDYNAICKDNPLPFIYITTDEFSTYMKNSIDTGQVAQWKDTCLDYILNLIKEGRSCGLYILSSLQRPDKENMMPSIKAQFGSQIVFRQPNTASSLVVCDNADATSLKIREALCITDEGRKLMKTVYFDNTLLTKYTADNIEKNHKFIDIQQKFELIEENSINISKNDEKPVKKQRNTKKNKEKIISLDSKRTDNKIALD